MSFTLLLTLKFSVLLYFHISYSIFHILYPSHTASLIPHLLFHVHHFPSCIPHSVSLAHISRLNSRSTYLRSICYIEYSHALQPQNEIRFPEISHKSHKKSTPRRNKNCHPTKQNSLPANFS